MATRGGDLHRSPGLLLAFHLAEVNVELGRAAGVRRRAHQWQRHLAFQVAEHLAQRGYRIDVQFLHQRGLGRIVAWNDQRAHPQGPGRQRDGEHPRHGPNAAVEGEFAKQHRPIQVGADLFGRRQNAHRHGQVERRPFLSHVGRREVHRDLAGGDLVV